MLTKSIITPFAPKYKLFNFQKYLKVIQKPLNSHMKSFNKSGSNFSYDSLIDDSLVNRSQNSPKFIEKNTGNSIKEFCSKKIILTSKKLKKSHSFVQEYEDLLTTLTKNPMKSVNNEETSSKSFNNFSVFEKIKPKLRSFLFLSNALSNKEPTLNPKPFVFNKLIFEIRRKSCGCRECGGVCEKLQKFSNFLTEKESKIVIRNNQRPKIKRNLKESHLSPNKLKFCDNKRVSLNEKARTALLRIKRNTVASVQKKSLNLLNFSNNENQKLITPIRTKLNNILNSDRYSSIKKNSMNNNMLYSVDNKKNSFRTTNLKEVSENNEKEFLLKNSSRGDGKRLTDLIEEKIKSTGRKSFERLGDSVRKNLFQENCEEKSRKSSKLVEKLNDLKPYNNKYFFGLAKKLNVFKISGNKSLIKNDKKKENRSALKEN